MKKIIVIGSGLSGCCIARMLAEKKYVVEIYEKRNHIGGHIFDYYDEHGILIHKYGPHIFHTNNDNVWNFVNKFTKFNNYINQVLVEIDNNFVELPINFNSIKQLFNNDFNDFLVDVKQNVKEKTISIKELLEKLKNEKSKEIIDYIFNKVYVPYSSKMWGIDVDKIDIGTLSRVKINLSYDWNYFLDDKYQGLPINGYSEMIKNILNHKNIKVNTNIDAKQNISFNNDIAQWNNEDVCAIIYTGQIDELFDYQFGSLPYRSLKIKFEAYNLNSFQKTAVINYPSHPTMTRICEYKKMTFQKDNNWTTISKEFPGEYDKNSIDFNIPFYPIKNINSDNIYNLYLNKSKKIKNLFLLGRLAQYKYFDMDEIIEECFKLIEKFN